MAHAHPPVPLLIDTDPGVDDAFALALATRAPEADLRGITSVFGNVGEEHTTANALRLRSLLDRPDVPVARGATGPLVHPVPKRAESVHGHDGLGGQAHALPAPGALDPRAAVPFLAETLAAADRPVTLVPIGPLTNIALLLAAHPEVRGKIARLVLMGGSLCGGNISAAAEFNVFSDPEAAQRVLSEDVPITVVPLDLTMRCTVDQGWLEKIAASGPVGKALVSVTEHHRANDTRELGRDAMAVHDALAVGEAITPGLLSTERMRVWVECGFGPGRGGLLADRRQAPDTGAEVDVALDADVPAVREFLRTRLVA